MSANFGHNEDHRPNWPIQSRRRLTQAMRIQHLSAESVNDESASAELDDTKLLSAETADTLRSSNPDSGKKNVIS